MGSAKITGVRIPSSVLTKINRGPAPVRASKRIAERAAVIAKQIAQTELGKGPNSNNSGKYANNFEIAKTVNREGRTIYVLRNETETRQPKGRQAKQRKLAPIIERGSKPHLIKPVNGKALFFRWDQSRTGYWRGTRNPAAGFKGDTPSRFPRYGVRHPGTRGRRIMQRSIQKAIRELARKN